jgi:UDPglucose 6-dehydrogenase
MIRTADEIGFDAAVLKAVEQRNERQKHFIVDKIRAHFDGDLNGRTFALWGLAFKPNTDDMREAPSRTIMEELWKEGATIRAFDPKAMPECRRIYGERDDLVLCEGQYEALEEADALIVVTEWKSFQAPDFTRIFGALLQPAIFDGRNIYSRLALRRHQIQHYAIGA